MKNEKDREELNIIVMGKTGAGKSTLINSVVGDEVALTGRGGSITKESVWYSADVIAEINDSRENSSYEIPLKMNLLDTVGLEISHEITMATLQDIRTHIEELSSQETTNRCLVWFCINDRSNRLEDYEADLIHELSLEYEIPFIIVFTQCINETGELKESLVNNLTNVVTQSVLAKEYIGRGITIPAFGIDELLGTSIARYDELKVSILEDKLLAIDTKRLEYINELQSRGEAIIKKYKERAYSVGRKLFPGKSAYIKKIRNSMFKELTVEFGLKPDRFEVDYISDKIANGLVNGGLMKLPAEWGGTAAELYIEDAGQAYLFPVIRIIQQSTNAAIKDKKELIEKSIKEMESSGDEDSTRKFYVSN